MKRAAIFCIVVLVTCMLSAPAVLYAGIIEKIVAEKTLSRKE